MSPYNLSMSTEVKQKENNFFIEYALNQNAQRDALQCTKGLAK